MGFEGKVALVTGASSGIGRATVIALARQGARVALLGRQPEGLELTAASLIEAGGRPEDVRQLAADVRDAAARERAVAEVVDAFGRLDVLVNAAGVLRAGTLAATPMEDWHDQFAINVDACFHLMQLALPSLEATRGSIVNVSSVTGLRAFPGVLAYCASKAALDQLTRCAALELATSGVRVNAVNPGVVVTQLHRRGGMEDAAYDAFLEHSKTTHPLGRVGRPEEVAEAILYLAGADWLTGVTLPVDGGRQLTCAR